MTVGNTITGSVADSLPKVIASARIVREYEGVMPQLVDVQYLGEGVGLDWHEVSFDKLEAQAVNETTELDNPQQISDSTFSITPTMIGVEMVITDRVAARIAPVAYGQIGALAQNAMQRKKDEDGLIVLDGATTSLCGAGTTLTSGYINAAVSRISSNANEPGKEPFYAVLHGYQIKDLHDELVASVGTYAVPEGKTARVFEEGFSGKVSKAMVFEDGNITIDSTDDAKGGVFAREGIVLVQGRMPRAVAERAENIGGGATKIYMYDEYAYGERSSGNWVFEIYSDATAPTS